MAIKPTRVTTGKVRLSFVNIFQPAQTPNGSLKYSVSIIIPKTDKETINKVNKAFEEAKAASASVFGGTVPKLLKGGLRDGDLEKEDPAYAGSMFINANSVKRPGVVDSEMNAILDPDEVYSGCYGRVAIDFYPYSVEGSKGIACGLGNVQKLEDGERLGSGFVTAEQDFAA
jgi:hypothetical protein